MASYFDGKASREKGTEQEREGGGRKRGRQEDMKERPKGGAGADGGGRRGGTWKGKGKGVGRRGRSSNRKKKKIKSIVCMDMNGFTKIMMHFPMIYKSFNCIQCNCFRTNTDGQR